MKKIECVCVCVRVEDRGWRGKRERTVKHLKFFFSITKFYLQKVRLFVVVVNRWFQLRNNNKKKETLLISIVSFSWQQKKYKCKSNKKQKTKKRQKMSRQQLDSRNNYKKQILFESLNFILFSSVCVWNYYWIIFY